MLLVCMCAKRAKRSDKHKIQRYVSNCQSSEYSQLHAVATEIENCLRSNVHCRCVDEDCSGIGVR